MPQPIRLLILEDVDDDARLLERVLRGAGLDFSATRVDTRAAFLEALSSGATDIILADYKLPDINGRQALALARKALPHVPVIIVTGTVQDEVAVQLLHEGAADYILKDRLSRLGPAVKEALGRARLEAEHARVAQALKREHAWLRQLVDANIIGILITDAAGGILEANQYFLDVVGCPREELARDHDKWNGTPPAWALMDEKAQAALREHGRTEPYERDYQRRDGRRVTVLVSNALLEGPDQRIAAFVLDITERKLSEQRLRDQLDELRRFQNVTVDRELRLQELEERIRTLTAQPPKAR